MKLTSLISFSSLAAAIALLIPGGPSFAQTQSAATVQTTVVEPSVAPTVVPAPTVTPEGLPAYGAEYLYDRNMRLGYAASKRNDYVTALGYFQAALTDRPGDRYATIAYWNMQDLIQRKNAPPTTAVNPAPNTPYDRHMRVGYAAAKKKDYNTALINFQRALNSRPGDFYATQAIRNVRTYITRGQ